MNLTFPGRSLDLSARPIIMGVLNVTPDSFSDGGQYDTVAAAMKRAEEMVAEGVDIIDVGGESTRPNAAPVSLDEELRRTIPVIELIAARFPDVLISIDTYKSAVADRALDAGAVIVNDVSAGLADAAMMATCGRRAATMVLMHMQGTPRTMQSNPVYGDVVHDVKTALAARAAAARAAGVGQIIIDPGIGFGKTLEHNLTLLRRLAEFHELGFPVLLGVSRKSFIGKLLGDAPASERLLGTAGAVAAGVLAGAQIHRVHDVRAMREAATIAFALRP